MLVFYYVEATRIFNINEHVDIHAIVLCTETEITLVHIHSIFLWHNALICCTSNVTIKHEPKAHVFIIPDVIYFYLVSSLSHLEYYHFYTRKNKKGNEYKTRIFFLIHDLKNDGEKWGELTYHNETQTSVCSA